MTTKLLLRTTALTCALMLGLNTLAQVEFYPDQMRSVSKPVGYVDSKVRFTTTDMQQSPMSTNQTLKAPKAEGEMCTLTINLDYDREAYMAPFMIDVITDNREGYRLFDFAMLGTFEQQVAAGTYHIICVFLSISQTATNRGAPIFVIKESVEITEDMTMTLSPDDATNHITLKNYSPDGELLMHDYGYYDSESGQLVTLAEGNVQETDAIYRVFLKGVGEITNYTINCILHVPTQEEQSGAGCDYYITDVSDRFLLTQARICQGKTLADENAPLYVSYFSTDNVKVGVLENTPANYVHHTETFKYSPYGKSQIGHGSGFKFSVIENNNWSGGRGSVSFYYTSPKHGETDEIETWINLPESDPIDNSYSYLFQTVAVDYGEVGQNVKVTGWIDGTPMTLKNGNLMKVNWGHYGTYTSAVSQDYNYLYAVINDNEIVKQQLPAPEAFTYPAEQALGNYGDNCPINTLQVTTYKANDQLNNSLMSYYVGRYGEVRWNNEGAYWAKRKFNGEEVDLETFATSGIGTRECTVINPNVEVDGLPGHNTTTVYYDQNQEDMTPPAVEMLHFKNADGGVTDRFATAEEGTMEFYASDFDYVYYPELWGGVFECQPVEVVVEYAPYGTEDWNELTVEEIPEFYQEPGWGYFYRGALAEVTGQGEKGWFDLRFRLQDASGNWQEQVVSPAFRIDDHAYSSVATISSDNAREVARYNLAGQRVDADATGVVIIKMSDGTARKVLK